MIIKILSVILFMYIMPCVVGLGLSRMLRLDDRTVVKSFVVGNIFIWALFQIVTVPLVLLKGTFSTVALIVSGILGIVFLWVLYDDIIRRKAKNLSWTSLKKRIPQMSKVEAFSFIIMIFMLFMLMRNIIFLQYTDLDDSRFVVNAVEMVRTDRLLLTDPITGEETETWIGELKKDVTSPWATYFAYCSKLVGLSVAITVHSVLPVSLILCSMGAFWLISAEFFKKDMSNRCIFMCFVVLLNIYGYFSRNSAETLRLARIWQGKGSVASIAIPALFLLCMWLYENEKKYGYYILIVMLNFGMCLMSGMGIVIGAIMLGCVGFVYGLSKKNLWITISLWGMCIPNVLYYVINSKLA